MIAVILSLPFAYLLVRRPVLRRLAVRNAARRPRETALVILGALLGTAIITSSYVVGDTLGSSIRHNAYTQLGPVDEQLVAPDAHTAAVMANDVRQARVPDVDGVLPLTTLVAAVSSTSAQPKAEPRAQVVEVDFAAARAFGGNPAATGISGPTPAGDTAVLATDLARTLDVRVGGNVRVFAFGSTRTFRVGRLVPRLGVAGLGELTRRSSDSPNIFVAPGTLAAMTAGGRATASGQAPPTPMLAVSNRGGVVAGAKLTAPVSAALQRAVAGLPVRVLQSKKTLLDDADASGKMFTTFFQSFGYFGVLAGVLLLVNIFVMLAQERKSSLGMLRAVGMRRASLVGSFSLEGWLYALVSAAAGALAGVGVGRVVVAVASGVFNRNGGRRESVDLHFAATFHSIVQGFSIGFVIALVTVVLTSLYIARINVIRAIRDLPEPPSSGGGRGRLVGAAVLTVAGVLLTVTGLTRSLPVPALVGPAVAGVGLEPILGRVFPRRAVISVISVVVLLWAVFVFSLIPGAFDKAGIAVFVVQGVVLTAFAVLLVTPNQGSIGAAIRTVGGGARNMSLRLGLAYPLAKRARTGLILSMYAIVVFVLTLLITISHLFGAQASDFSRKLAGGSSIEVESNPASPIPASGVAAMPGVRWVTATSATPAEFPAPDSTEADDTTVVGFDRSFIGHGAPQLHDREAGDASDAATYAAVAADPGKVLVGRDFSPGRRREGPGGGNSVKVGDAVTLRDTVTGATRRLTVAGLVEETQYNGADHAFVSAALARDLFGARATPDMLFVGTRPGTDADALAASIDGRYLPNGADANSFARLVALQLAQQQRFFTLIRGYVALGLLVGVAGLGVVMVRAVRERRREIGVLRSLGFSGVAVRRAFVAESSFIAAEGVGIGAALALVTAWRLVASNSFGNNLPFSVPWLQLIVLLAGTLVASLLATAAPAQQASRIRPAVALRMAD